MTKLLAMLSVCVLSAAASTSQISGTVQTSVGCFQSATTNTHDLNLSCSDADHNNFATVSAHATPIEAFIINTAGGGNGEGGGAEVSVQESGHYYFTGFGQGANINPYASFIGTQPGGLFSLVINGIDYSGAALFGNLEIPIIFGQVYDIEFGLFISVVGGSNNDESSGLEYGINLPPGVQIAETPEASTLVLCAIGSLFLCCWGVKSRCESY